MALDIGISALQVMFKLAKAIKEAQTDVLFIIDKVNDAESLSRLVEVNMARLNLDEIPGGIYKEILKRNVAAKRLTRKLRLKYEPLLNLFSSLGGNATAIKMQASMLKRSVDGGAMGLNSLCILVDRHLNRLESSSKTAIINALKELGRSVDQYDKYSLAEMCKIMREADQATKTQFISTMALFDKLCGGPSGLADAALNEAGHAVRGAIHLDPRAALNALADPRAALSALSEKPMEALQSLGVKIDTSAAVQRLENLAERGLHALNIDVDLPDGVSLDPRAALKALSDPRAALDALSDPRTAALSDTAAVKQQVQRRAEKELKALNIELPSNQLDGVSLDPAAALSANSDSRAALSTLSALSDKQAVMSAAMQKLERLADQDETNENDAFDEDTAPTTKFNSASSSLKAKRDQAIKLGNTLHSPLKKGSSGTFASSNGSGKPLSIKAPSQVVVAVAAKKRPLGAPKDLSEEDAAAIALQRIAKRKLNRAATSSNLIVDEALAAKAVAAAKEVLVEDAETIAARKKKERQESKLKFAKDADALNLAQKTAQTAKMFTNFFDAVAAMQAEVDSDDANKENMLLIPDKRAELRKSNAEFKAQIHKKAAVVFSAKAEIARRMALVENASVKRSMLSSIVQSLPNSETVEEHQRAIAEITADLEQQVAELDALTAKHQYEAQERIDAIMALLPPMVAHIAPLLPAGISIADLLQGEVPKDMKTDVDFIEDAGLSFQGYEFKGVMNEKARLLLKEITEFITAIRQMNKEANIMDDEDDACNAPDELYTAQSSIKASTLAPEHERSTQSVLAKGMDLIVQRISMGGSKKYLDENDLLHLIGKQGTSSMVGVLRRFITKGARSAPDDRSIETERFVKYLRRDMKKNIGLRMAAFCMCMVDKLSPDGFPSLVGQAIENIESLIQPLLNYATSLGIMLAIEHIREVEKENPAEVMALEAEADELELENRLNLIGTFADDLKDSFEHGFAPDPSMMLSIAIEVGNSFFGFGPTTKRRLNILKNIMGVLTVEKDRMRIELVDASIKNELVVIQSLPSRRDHVQIKGDAEGDAPIMEQQKLMMELLMAQKHSYDVRNVLGENTETARFWISSFGKESYEVMWLRFRTAFLNQYGNASERYLLKIRPLLIDFRGIVTIESLVAVINQNSNFSDAINRGRQPAAASVASATPKSALVKKSSKKKGMSKSEVLTSPYLIPDKSFKKSASRDSMDGGFVQLQRVGSMESIGGSGSGSGRSGSDDSDPASGNRSTLRQ